MRLGAGCDPLLSPLLERGQGSAATRWTWPSRTGVGVEGPFTEEHLPSFCQLFLDYILTGTHSALKRGAVVASALHKAPPVFIVLGLAYCAWDQTPARQEVPQLPSAPRLARPGLERPGASQAEANIPMAGDLSLVVVALPEAIVKPLLAARELGFEWIFSHQWDQGYSPGACPMLQRAPSRHAAMQGAATPAAHSPLPGQQRRLTLPAWVREGFLTTPHWQCPPHRLA